MLLAVATDTNRISYANRYGRIVEIVLVGAGAELLRQLQWIRTHGGAQERRRSLRELHGECKTKLRQKLTIGGLLLE